MLFLGLLSLCLLLLLTLLLTAFAALLFTFDELGELFVFLDLGHFLFLGVFLLASVLDVPAHPKVSDRGDETAHASRADDVLKVDWLHHLNRVDVDIFLVERESLWQVDFDWVIDNRCFGMGELAEGV